MGHILQLGGKKRDENIVAYSNTLKINKLEAQDGINRAVIKVAKNAILEIEDGVLSYADNKTTYLITLCEDSTLDVKNSCFSGIKIFILTTGRSGKMSFDNCTFRDNRKVC